MIRVSIKQVEGTASRIVSVSAETIERALEIVPGEVVFPIEPEAFFTPEEEEVA